MSPFDRLFRRQKPQTPPSQAPAAAPMIEIGSLLGKDTILFFDRPTKKSEVIQTLVNAMGKAYSDVSIKSTYQAIMEREKLTSTFMESGIAVPHARLAKLSAIRAALGVVVNPAPISRDQASIPENTRFIFLFVSPEKDFTAHLQTLSRASWLFQNPIFKEKVTTLKDPAAVLALLRQIEPHSPNEKTQ